VPPRSNRTRYTILGTLTFGPKTGYDIKKFIKGTISNFWHESYGQIYPTLKRLAFEGLVTRRVEEQNGKPARYIYELTGLGREELREWLVEPAARSVPRIEILLKLFFGAEVSAEENLRHVRRHRGELERGLALCVETENKLKSELHDEPGLPYWLLGVRQGILVQRALLQWCDEADEVIGRLERREGNDKAS
jgi:DNA-binding PadR family transcriptional regulator